MKTQIATEKAPGAIGPYSQAIDCGPFVYASGQIPLNPVTGEIPEGIQAQTRQSLANVKAIMEAAGLSMKNIVKTTVFLADMADFVPMNEILCRGIRGSLPRPLGCRRAHTSQECSC